MEKTKILGIVGVVVLIGGIIFFTSDSSRGDIKNDFNKMNALDVNQGITCRQEVKVLEDNKLINKMYFYKNKMRFDSSLEKETQGQKDMHMISDGEYNYLWGQGMIGAALGGVSKNQGMKMKIDDQGEMANSVDVKELKENNWKVPGISCESWNPDMSIFELPQDINFIDPSNMMPGFGGKSKNSTPTGFLNQCKKACQDIPNEKARAECENGCADFNK